MRSHRRLRSVWKIVLSTEKIKLTYACIRPERSVGPAPAPGGGPGAGPAAAPGEGAAPPIGGP